MFHIKQNLEGYIAWYKACLVAKAFHQQLGINFHKTFSPVINFINVRIVLNIALNHKWGILQLYVNNAFLQYVSRLHKAIYGLKQAPWAWYQAHRTFLLNLNFVTSREDSSLFVYSRSNALIYFLVYVDDLIITSSYPSLVDNIIR